MHRKHVALGATLTVEEGWQRPARYASPEEELRRLRAGCGLCDLSPIAKWDVKGRDLDPALPPVLRVARIPEGLAGSGTVSEGSRPADRFCCRLAEDHALFAADLPKGQEWTPVPLTGGCLHVTDVTSTLAAFSLVGPRSRELLSKLTSLNLTDRCLPDFSCAQTGLAKCHAILARLDTSGLLAYRLFVTRDYAEFVWDALTEAGHDCGLAPFGIEAWRALG